MMRSRKTFEVQVEDEMEETPKTTLNTKVLCAMKNLQTLYKNDPNKIVNQAA